ncbi:hypothetical protein [Borreliella tanukii]|uniref:hypothetical protein n=1 Tax=Borreliella tanukii TaxID=56146 RepID=UPI0026482718|nr:hypothetical protein [Borreliella tanukii]WKC81023.1 hypothetical protein QIA29_04250 [Borreliella tanukii]WKC81938.1 hypothetical protein QIA27_04250 [Borreliella tanukii]
MNKKCSWSKEKVEMVESFVFLKEELLKLANIYKSKIFIKTYNLQQKLKVYHKNLLF